MLACMQLSYITTCRLVLVLSVNSATGMHAKEFANILSCITAGCYLLTLSVSDSGVDSTCIKAALQASLGLLC